MACKITKGRAIEIDGSNQAFGYVTQGASFNFSFGEAPSTAEITMVYNPDAVIGEEEEGEVELLKQYELGLGGLKFKMIAMAVSHNYSATGATTKSISFVDTSINFLDKYYIALNRTHLMEESPSEFLIGLGEKYALKKDIDGYGNVSIAPSRAYINLANHVAGRNAAYINAANSLTDEEAQQEILKLVIKPEDFQEYIDGSDGTALYLIDDFFAVLDDKMPGKIKKRVEKDEEGNIIFEPTGEKDESGKEIKKEKETLLPEGVPEAVIEISVENMGIKVDGVGAEEVCQDYLDKFKEQFKSQSEMTTTVVATAPVIQTKGEFVNYTGTVREVLSAFAKDYGFIFFWDAIKEEVVFMDSSEGVPEKFVEAEAGLLSSNCNLISRTSKTDASNTVARGALGTFSASEDGAANDNKRLGNSTAELVSFSNFIYNNCEGEEQSFKLSATTTADVADTEKVTDEAMKFMQPAERHAALIANRQIDVAQAKRKQKRQNDPAAQLNAGFEEAMRAAAISSKFYGMYVLYKMMVREVDAPVDDDVPAFFQQQQQNEIVIKNLLKGKGLVGNVKPEQQLFIAGAPAGIASNPFIESVYNTVNCPDTSCQDDLGRNAFAPEAIEKMKTLIKDTRERKKQTVFTATIPGTDPPQVDPNNLNPQQGEVELPPGIQRRNADAGGAVKLKWKDLLRIVNEANPAIGCVCLKTVDKKDSKVIDVIVAAANDDGNFARQMAVNGAADEWIFTLIENGSAATIYSKGVDAANDQMYQLLKAYSTMGNRFYVLMDDGQGEGMRKGSITVGTGAKAKKVSRSYRFLIMRESAWSERSYAIPSGAQISGINPYLRADQDNPFKDLFLALLKMTYGPNPALGTTEAGTIQPEEYPAIIDFIAALKELASDKKDKKTKTLKDLFRQFVAPFTAKEIQDRKELAEKNCDKLDDDVVMLVFDTQSSGPKIDLSEAQGEVIKKAEDGFHDLKNDRTKNVSENFQALIKCDSPVAFRGLDVGDAIPAKMDIPALSGNESPGKMKLLYSFDRKARWNQQDGYFKTSAVKVPTVPDGESVAKFEMDLGVGVTAEQLGYADSSFSKLTDEELLGNGWSLFFQKKITDRLHYEIEKKVQLITSPSTSNTYKFIATEAESEEDDEEEEKKLNFPDIPSPVDGLESLSISLGDTVDISVTIGSRRKAEAAQRMRNSPVTAIGGNSSVQQIAINPSTAVLPPNIRALM